MTDPNDPEAIYECDSCDRVEQRANLPDADDLWVRLDPGNPYTDKECPDCGALMYPVTKHGGINTSTVLRDARSLHNLLEENESEKEGFLVDVSGGEECLRLIFRRPGKRDRQLWIEQQGDNIVAIPAHDADGDADAIMEIRPDETAVQSNNGHDDWRRFNRTNRPK